ncbi:MAG: zinc ABC transporter substrate-binding protein [Candidatus Aureabacteria bacterium]|nr:zinc ABC transporter substrate-binding protein [Candidatus Auribacterota bacterium]
MKRLWFLIYLTVAGILFVGCLFCEAKTPLKVVTTLPDYAVLAKQIGKERVSVTHIVYGDQDAHFIRPKPSFVTEIRDTDVLISTGLDLELWLPTIINKSGNTHIRSGQSGYVSAAQGMNLLEKPVTISRMEGGVHIYGNPHVTCSPINMKVAARNIAIGLTKNDPEGKEAYLANLKNLLDEIDKCLFGEALVQMLGGDTLCSLAEKGTLIPFLKRQKLHDKPLIDYLGGWMKKMLSIRGTFIVTYHKNWVYFLKLFGLKEAGTIEPKPGIPPSPKHVTSLVEMMRERNIQIILAANYFDEQKIRTIANRVDAKAVIVPLYVGGETGVNDYFQLVDCWINGLIAAYHEKGPLSRQ